MQTQHIVHYLISLNDYTTNLGWPFDLSGAKRDQQNHVVWRDRLGNFLACGKLLIEKFDLKVCFHFELLYMYHAKLVLLFLKYETPFSFWLKRRPTHNEWRHEKVKLGRKRESVMMNERKGSKWCILGFWVENRPGWCGLHAFVGMVCGLWTLWSVIH